MIQQVLAVAVGGALGSCIRFAVAKALPQPENGLPWATILVNLAGCLLIGIAVSWSTHKTELSPELRALVITGFLGGLTTFSAFGLESVLLAKDGKLWLTAVYLTLQVGGGLLAVLLGFWLGRNGW